MFSLGIGGCGYKAAPFYTKKVEQEDKNVVFIQNLKKESVSDQK